MNGPQIRDRNINWLRKLLWIPANIAQCYTITVTATGASNTGVAHTQEATASSTISIITSGANNSVYTALKIAATGAGFDTLFPLPYDLDITRNIGFSALWTHRATGATALATATWQVLYNTVAMPQIAASGGSKGGVFLNSATMVATGALDTAITAQTNQSTGDTLPTLYFSPRGLISGKTLGQGSWNAGFMFLNVLLSTATASFTDEIYLLGVVMDYEMRKTFGRGKVHFEAGAYGTPLLQNWLDLNYNPAVNAA